MISFRATDKSIDTCLEVAAQSHKSCTTSHMAALSYLTGGYPIVYVAALSCEWLHYFTSGCTISQVAALFHKWLQYLTHSYTENPFTLCNKVPVGN